MMKEQKKEYIENVIGLIIVILCILLLFMLIKEIM